MAPTIRDSLASGIDGVGSRISRIAGLVRGSTVAPESRIPGVASAAGLTRSMNSESVLQKLLGIVGYTGRVTYDAGPAWTRYSSYPATDLTPEKIAGAQQEALAGYPLRWEEMIEQVWARDSHLSGIGQQRIDDVVKGAWRLQRAAPDDLALCVRNFCDQQLRELDTMEEADGWLLMSNAYCYNAAEITWRVAQVSFPGPNGKIIGPVSVFVPARLDPVHPKHFRFDLRTDEPFIWLGSDAVELPYGKFIFMKGEGHHPITERHGYMWPCVWLSMIRSIGFAGWAAYVERFGMPTPLVEFDGDITQYHEHKRAYDEILHFLGRGIGAIIPSRNFKLEFAKAEGGGRANDPHSALADACDSAQSIRVLGATLTAKIGNAGSFAASSNHTEVKYNKEEHDARRLWRSKRSGVIEPMVRFNARVLADAITKAGYSCRPEDLLRRVPAGMQRVPRDSDLSQQKDIVSAAINEWGLDISSEGLYDRFDLPQPYSKDDIAPGKPQQVTAGGKVLGTNEASNDGAEAPKDEPPAKSPASPQQPKPPAGGQGEQVNDPPAKKEP